MKKRTRTLLCCALLLALLLPAQAVAAQAILGSDGGNLSIQVNQYGRNMIDVVVATLDGISSVSMTSPKSAQSDLLGGATMTLRAEQDYFIARNGAGHVVISLASSYLSTLAEGRYTLQVYTKTNKATASITLQNPVYSAPPEKGSVLGDPQGPFREEGRHSVNAPSLNVRAGAGTEFAVIGSVSNGDAVHMIYQSDVWGYVRLPNGNFGFVHTKYLIAQQ